MFNSLHIHITTLSCFDWPVSLFSLISLHHTHVITPEIHQINIPFHLLYNHTIPLLNKTPHSHPNPLLTAPSTPSLCLLLVKASVKGGLTTLQQHPHPPLLVLRSSPDTLTHTPKHTCLGRTLSLPAQIAELIQC